MATKLEMKWAMAVISLVSGIVLLYHGWASVAPEDAIPIFSCHTMGNFECPPNTIVGITFNL